MFRKNSHLLVISMLFIAITGSYLLMAIQFPLAYITATYEDLFGEWLQVFLVTAAFLLSARLSLTKSKFRLFFAILGLACFYVAGEEISWGQRIFNIPTPDFFRTHNIQNETNLHNLLTGPVKSVTKQGIEIGLCVALILYGLVFPVLVRRRVRLAIWFEDKGIPSPPLYLWPFFVTGAFLELGILKFNEAELAEILIYFALALFALHYLQQNGQGLSGNGNNQQCTSVQKKIAWGSVAILLLALSASFATTSVSNASPRLKKKAEARFLNGVEKFAARYKRYGQWDTAAKLYLMVNEQEPGRVSILRNTAACYHKLDDRDNFALYNKKALQADLAKLRDKPYSVSVNLSLSRTYRQADNEKGAWHHLDIALENARKRLEKNPQNAKAAYWLGKTHEARQEMEMALDHYRRAAELAPDSEKYQRAYERVLK